MKTQRGVFDESKYLRLGELFNPITDGPHLGRALDRYYRTVARDDRTKGPHPLADMLEYTPASLMPPLEEAPSAAKADARTELEMAFRSVVQPRLEQWRLAIDVGVTERDTPFYRPPQGNPRPTTIKLGHLAMPISFLLAHSPYFRNSMREVSRDSVTESLHPATHADRVAKLAMKFTVDGFQRREYGGPSFVGRIRVDDLPGFEVNNGRHQLLAHIVCGQPSMVSEVTYETHGLPADQQVLSVLQRHQLMTPGSNGRLVAPPQLELG